MSIRSAVPNPLAILSMTNSFNWKQLVTSTAYTIIDSYSSYKTTSEAADQEFLMSGWELDDEETESIQRNRKQAFDYMIDIVRDYSLDGKLTLNEQAVNAFSEICKIESVQQKIRRLESEEETYKFLGLYWLELADCYYQTSQYQKCLDCVYRYASLSTGIYRKDRDYAQFLPKAIVAAQETYTGDEYISRIESFANDIIENSSTEEWSIRYFTAQVYLDLYTKTNNKTHLETAYNIIYDNVAVLIDGQRELNTTYLNDVQELTIPKPDFKYEDDKKKAEKEYKSELKRLKAYNKSLKKARETELPPLYEPLVLHCDLLFALADKVGINSQEKTEIEELLKDVFLSKSLNDSYSFSAPSSEYKIKFDKDSLVIPANLLSSNAKIVVSVADEETNTTFDDYKIEKVVRKGTTVDTFEATISSKQMKSYKWTADSRINVTITNGNEENPIVLLFKVVELKDNWMISDKVVFDQE